MYDYASLKALAKQQKRPVTDLIALAPQNDPFYFGTERDVRMGKWFADLWHRFGYTSGVHLRRMHYAVVSQNPAVIRSNGTPYENTEECWFELAQASKAARYLELVDPAAFIDRRNGEPIDHAAYDGIRTMSPGSFVSGDYVSSSIVLPSFPDLPHLSFYGISAPQRYHMEIWCEKSTMNDILDRVASVYRAVVQYGMGELSITVALEAIRRFERSGKPVRVLYVSDHDPAGAGMPVSMSRKLEYFIHKEELDIDVKLFPIVLTHEQVKHYNRLLPTPIKETERRKDKFEKRYGGGAVELDALEALYPGELQRILVRELQRYHDSTLSSCLSDARGQYTQALGEIQEEVYGEFRDQIDTLETEYEAIAQMVKDRGESYSQQLKDLWHAISNRLGERMPFVEPPETPEAAKADERDGALYDSARDYLEQNDVYQAYKGKEAYEQTA